MKAKLKQRLSVDERKHAMLAAARELFLAKGYAATSLEDIVNKSGGSLATLYQIFGNKEGLWRELVLSYCESVSSPLQDPHLSDGPPRQVLRAFAGRLLALLLNPEMAGGMRMIVAESAHNPDFAHAIYVAGPERGRKIVAEYLARQVQLGTLDIPDPALAGDLFCQMVEGDMLLWHACGIRPTWTDAELDRRLDAALDVFMAAYEPKSRPPAL